MGGMVEGVFDHVSFRVSDPAASEAFYRALLSPLGREPVHKGESIVEWGDFSIIAANPERPPTTGAEIEFAAPTRQLAGSEQRDPAGNTVRVVHSPGHDDHDAIARLALHVSDPDAAASFYALLTTHASRGYGDALELVAGDGPPTEHLHLALAAPEEAVRTWHAAAVKAGYRSEGGPGERPKYHPGYYAAFVLDPDGNNAELVDHHR